MALRNLWFWVHIVVLIAGAVVVRCWGLFANGPSFNELLVAVNASHGWREYVRLPYPDFSPPVVYLFYRAVYIFTPQFDSLRLASALAGSLAPLLLYVLGRKHFGESVAVFASYLLMIHPLHVAISQQVDSLNLGALLAIPAFIYMMRSIEGNRVHQWIIYDVAATLLLLCHREAIFFVAVLPILQLTRLLFFPPTHDQRRIRRLKLLQSVVLHHVVICALAVSWLVFAETKLPYDPMAPHWRELVTIFGRYLVFGNGVWPEVSAWVGMAVLFLLLAPPLIKTLQRIDYRTFALFGILMLVIGGLFGYSMINTSRFIAWRDAGIITPFFCLFLGLLLNRCNMFVRTGLLGALVAVMGTSTVIQARTIRDTTPSSLQRGLAAAGIQKEDTVVFWPDFTATAGDFWKRYYQMEMQPVAATEFVERWASMPESGRLFFAVSDFPMRAIHGHSFSGVLLHHANGLVLWKDRLNMLVQAQSPDQMALRAWYSNPGSLQLVDKPAPETQFIYTPLDPQLRNKQFHHERHDLMFEDTGHRFVWTAQRQVTLDLPVNLVPGQYILKLHAASDFEQPSEGRFIRRSVGVELRTGEDRRKVTLDKPTVIALRFNTDVDLKELSVVITADQPLEVSYPNGGTFGIKVYSISIDQVESVEDTLGF